MGFTEEQVMEALGLPPAPDGDGAEQPPEGQDKEQESGRADAPPPEGDGNGAEPAPEQEPEALNAREQAAKTRSGVDGFSAPEGPENGARSRSGLDAVAEGMKRDNTDAPPAQEQEPEVPAWVLEAQRRAQQQAAFERAVQEARRQAYEEARKVQEEELRGFFAQAGLRDPYNDAPITTMEQYRDYMARSRMEQLSRELAQGKLTPEGLNEAIRLAMTPRAQGDSVQEPQAAEPVQPVPAARPEEQPASQRDRARIEAEVAEIARMDPAVKEMGDLLRQPWSREFYQFVQEGHSFLGAYHRAVSGEQARQAAEAARQKAIDQVHSKDHLTAGAAPQGGGMDAVPPEDMKYFRLFMPNASDEEIQKYYNRSKQKR